MNTLTLTNVPKPKTKYDALKTKPLSIKHHNNRYTLRFRSNPKDKKEKPLTLSFADREYDKDTVMLIQWWLEELIWVKKEDHPLTDLHNDAIDALKEICPRQFKRIVEEYNLIEEYAQTVGELFAKYREEYLERVEQDRDPGHTGNHRPIHTIDLRISWVLEHIPEETDPLKIDGRYLAKVFRGLINEGRNKRGNKYSLATLVTYWSFIISVYKRSVATTHKWLRYNPIEGLSRNAMPYHQKWKRDFARRKQEAIKLTADEREYLIEACADNVCLQAMVVYLLHKPSRLAEPKDMVWKDIDFRHGEELVYVNAKVDKKKTHVYRQWVPVAEVFRRYIMVWKTKCLDSGGGKPSDRVWSIWSDNHLCWNRAVRDMIKTRIRWWNTKYPHKQIPVYENIGNVLRSNALYYLVDNMKMEWRDAAVIGGTSVDMLERHYLTDKNAAAIQAAESFTEKQKMQSRDLAQTLRGLGLPTDDLEALEAMLPVERNAALHSRSDR